ncbi:hypothetical protein Hdeb2414_s0002g00060521 [Helianthus debilis subsp. tardiflorus]
MVFFFLSSCFRDTEGVNFHVYKSKQPATSNMVNSLISRDWDFDSGVSVFLSIMNRALTPSPCIPV